jgi:hypothetical protein
MTSKLGERRKEVTTCLRCEDKWYYTDSEKEGATLYETGFSDAIYIYIYIYIYISGVIFTFHPVKHWDSKVGKSVRKWGAISRRRKRNSE